MTKMQVSDGMDREAVSTQHTGAAVAPISGNATVHALSSPNGITSIHTDSRGYPDPCALNVPSPATERQCAEVAALATFAGLSPQQAYGEVCVGTCGRSFLQPPYPTPIYAGIAEHGGAVFACPDCAAMPVEAGGLGMDPADGWQGGRS